MIIDFHAHIGLSKVFGGKYCDAEAVVEVMDKAGIDKAVLIPTASSIHTRLYEDVVEAVKEFPERFIGFTLVDPKKEDAVENMEKVVTRYNLRGLKLHPTFMAFAADDEELVYPIVQKAEELQIAVMVHSGQSPYATPWQVGLLAMDFPKVPIIMAHMGLDEVVYIDAAINMAKRAKNLILETTGVTAEAKIAQAVREIGASRVVYGSDMPFHNPEVEMAKVKGAEISDEDRRLILGGNAARLFDL